MRLFVALKTQDNPLSVEDYGRTIMIDLEQNLSLNEWFINKIYVVTAFKKRTCK
jgi:hypothetical protein